MTTVKNASLKEFIASLAEAIPEDRLTYQKGIATVHPESALEASAVFKLAKEKNQRLYITGFGNNIDPIGPEFEDLLVIRTDRLGDIRRIDPSGLSIEVGAGYPLGEMNQKLKESGLFFPLAGLAYPGSVAGAIATNLSADLDPEFWKDKLLADGSPTPAAIDIKRYLLEVQIVLPSGEIKRIATPSGDGLTGGSFAAIFCPSWGLFGMIISAKLRVMPESGKIEYSNLRQRQTSIAGFLEQVKSESDYLYQVRKKFDGAGVLTDTPLQRSKE